MKVRAISSGPIEDLFNHPGFLQSKHERIVYMDNEIYSFDRRALLKIASISAVSFISFPLFLRENSYSQPTSFTINASLIFALISLLQLLKQFYAVREPTNGRFTLANESYNDKSGLVELKVVGRGSVDDLKHADYEVPAREYVQYEFNEGPMARTRGEKALGVRTRYNEVQTPLRVA